MNWIEKVNLINSQAEMCKVGDHFSLLALNKDEKSLLDLEKRIKHGKLEAVKEIVSILKPQLEVYKAAIKVAKKYKASGGKLEIQKSISSCDLLPLEFSTSGVLIVKSLYWNICPLKEQSKFFLWASRLLRDAEVRCLKHPMYKGV